MSAKQRNIKLTVEYDGTNFNGWQIQTARSASRANQNGKRTVQGEIEKALNTIFKHPIKLNGSGRTDSGVHALGQVANFKTVTAMPAAEMVNALNANLPADIAVLNAEDVPGSFHAQYSAKSKTYRYTVLNSPSRCAQQRDFCFHYPYKLNLRKMRDASKALIGKNDFRSFRASDPDKRKKKVEVSTVRTIQDLKIRKKGDLIQFEIQANGFLYKMVRNIVGTLLEVGAGRLPAESVRKILLARDRCTAGKTAKAKGLSLLRVEY